MKICAIVVVFNKTAEQSLTIESIAKYANFFKSIVIFNNGPKSISLSELDLPKNFTLVNNNKNLALSKIYNDFIIDNNADRYVILDDDTCITESYIKKLILRDEYYHLGLPLIVSSHDKEIYYPVMTKVRNIFADDYMYCSGMYSISSGMILSKEMVSAITKKYNKVFDERFALYGVDISLFYRLDSLTIKNDLVCHSEAVLTHELSKFQTEKSTFRIEELLIDQLLQYKIYHKNKKRLFLYLYRNKGSILRLKLSSFRRVILSYLSSRHPRSR